jgi:TetR/AcrR family transcriptional repressor of lmrAB and yxaGH operons
MRSKAHEPRARQAIIRTTAKLLRKQGYAATGLNQIVLESGTPKGSLYHYFPGGKGEVALAALRFAGDLVLSTLQALDKSHAKPGAIVLAYGELLVGWLGKSGYSDGCPVTTTLLETAPANPVLTEAGRMIFDSWESIFARSLERAGADTKKAAEAAQVAIMMIEGSLILARVKEAPDPIRLACREVAALFERVSGTA